MRVLIVGGGTAGWMSALYLARLIGVRQKLEIELIEAPDIGAIGVGEATIPTIRQTLRDLGITEREFLLKTNGAFKQAVCFRDWLRPPMGGGSPSEYFHPFEVMSNEEIYSSCEYIRRTGGGDQSAYLRAGSRQYYSCVANKAPLPLSRRAQSDRIGYAFHTDAILFGGLLREQAMASGVRRIEARVRGVEGDPEKGIRSVVLENGARREADLYIDCSGFHRLLLQGCLGEVVESFSPWLPCNRAIAASAEYRQGEVIYPYTIAHAQSAGWIWDISLASRRGCGYVYSDSHISDEQALASLASYLNRPVEELDARYIDMHTGVARHQWQGNCIAIGLAGGFIEPLESTGIALIEMGIRCLIDHWPGYRPPEALQAMKRGFNTHMSGLYQEILEFIVLHYRLSQRQDSAFWQDLASLGVPDRLASRLELWRYKVPSEMELKLQFDQIFGLSSYISVIRGMCWGESGYSRYHDSRPTAELLAEIESRQARWKQSASRLPGHAAYLLALRS